jgi:3-hydroxymyristoyl/3-hydroxydecanoyl-(acyl carrier protein) dehydratase
VFHFVDRILECEPGGHALGLKHVTAADVFVRPAADDPPALLSCIVGEALGQLGAWSAMAANDFTLRPVAGVVGAVEILGEARQGDSIRLDTMIDSLTGDAVYYHAVATVAGDTILTLDDALGPLLPLEDFNDPEELRARYAAILRPDASPGATPGGEDSSVPVELDFDQILSWESGTEATAIRQVSADEPFFSDHFPRKAVYPLSLLLESLLELGRELLAADGIDFRPVRARKVKMSRFIEPGASVTANARVVDRGDDHARLKFRCEVDGARVCVAEAEYAAMEIPG